MPPSVPPCTPRAPRIPPTTPPTIPLRMSPAPRAASQPKMTLVQLVFLYPCDNSYDMPWVLPLSWLRRPSPERTSFSSTLGAPVLPSPLVLSLISFISFPCEPQTTFLLLTLGSVLGHGPFVEQCRRYSPDDGPQDVEPNASEVARNEHRPEGANRVDGASGDGASNKDPDCKGEAHRNGGYG